MNKKNSIEMYDELIDGLNSDYIDYSCEYWPFGDFENWFKEIIELLNPDLIVGIARGAIRFLQLHGIEKMISSIPIITNHALSFIPIIRSIR